MSYRLVRVILICGVYGPSFWGMCSAAGDIVTGADIELAAHDAWYGHEREHGVYSHARASDAPSLSGSAESLGGKSDTSRVTVESGGSGRTGALKDRFDLKALQLKVKFMKNTDEIRQALENISGLQKLFEQWPERTATQIRLAERARSVDEQLGQVQEAFQSYLRVRDSRAREKLTQPLTEAVFNVTHFSRNAMLAGDVSGAQAAIADMQSMLVSLGVPERDASQAVHKALFKDVTVDDLARMKHACEHALHNATGAASKHIHQMLESIDHVESHRRSSADREHHMKLKQSEVAAARLSVDSKERSLDRSISSRSRTSSASSADAQASDDALGISSDEEEQELQDIRASLAQAQELFRQKRMTLVAATEAESLAAAVEHHVSEGSMLFKEVGDRLPTLAGAASGAFKDILTGREASFDQLVFESRKAFFDQIARRHADAQQLRELSKLDVQMQGYHILVKELAQINITFEATSAGSVFLEPIAPEGGFGTSQMRRIEMVRKKVAAIRKAVEEVAVEQDPHTVTDVVIKLYRESVLDYLQSLDRLLDRTIKAGSVAARAA